MDESGFYLLPQCLRTYAPRGQTPILRAPLSRDHLSVISGVSDSGRLLVQSYTHSICSPEVIAFMKHLLRQIQGKIWLLWDRAPIHRSQEVHDFLATPAAQRLHLEYLPPYAPELNPDEGVWQLLKKVLANTCCRYLGELKVRLK